MLRIYTTTLFHSHSHVAHVCCHSRRPLLDIPRREARLLYPKREREREKIFFSFRKRSLDVFASPLPLVSRVLSLFRTPSTSYYFSRFPLTLGRTSGISHVYSKQARTHGLSKKRSSVYTSRSRPEREIKPGDFASFRASLLFGLVLFVDRRFCINRNLSPPKTKPP